MRKILAKIEDYPAYLEACWQEHLKKFEEKYKVLI
jgi:hypothetical protein